MRKVYIALVVAMVTSVMLFIATFLYLDREKHGTYYYAVELEGKLCGSMRVDQYVTEDKRIYKSVSEMPLRQGIASYSAKLSLLRNYELDEYAEENSGSGAEEYNLIRNDAGDLSFLSTYGPRFAYLKSMPIRRSSLLLRDDSLITYIPLVENYDFKKGRVQGFPLIRYFDHSLPPMKIFLTLTSIRDEFLKVDGRRVKTECLVVRARGCPQVMVWVSKLDHTIIMVELPQEDLKFTRTFSYKKVRRAEGASAKKVSYAVRDVLFRNKKVELSGTLTVPNGDSPRPPVVLIPDSGVVDRDCLGIFSDIADRLTENGFAVLRFDKRGIGSSTGDFGSLSDEDERADIKAAIEFLATQKGIDMGRLVVLGYSKGGYLASRIASEDARVKGCIILAGLAYTNEALSGFQALRARAVRDNWPEAYIKIALQSKLEAMDIVKKTDKGWQSLLGRRCFIKKMREEMEERPLETMKNVKVPVLLLHGSNDDQVPSEYAKLLDRSLEEAGNMARTLVYFGYLSHYFGKRVFDGKSRVAYAVDAQALDTIGNWLKNVVGPSSAPQGSVGTENPKG